MQDRQNALLTHPPPIQLSLSNSRQLQNGTHTHMSWLLLYALHRLIHNKIRTIFGGLRHYPGVVLRSRQRMHAVIMGLFKRQDYNAKWNAFQQIRGRVIQLDLMEINSGKANVNALRWISARIMLRVVVGKRKQHIAGAISKMYAVAMQVGHSHNQSYRKGIRLIIGVYQRRVLYPITKLRFTKYAIERQMKVKSVVRLITSAYKLTLTHGYTALKRNCLRERIVKGKTDIMELEQKIKSGEPEQMKALREREKEMHAHLQGVKKEKQELVRSIEQEQRDAQSRKEEMEEELKQLRMKSIEIGNKIKQASDYLSQPYSIDEIYHCCYLNMLQHIAGGNTSGSDKVSSQALLTALQYPLISIDVDKQKLIEENQLLKQVIGQYTVMYGVVDTSGSSTQQMPYEYMVKENAVLYKIMQTLLGRGRRGKEELAAVKDSLERLAKFIS